MNREAIYSALFDLLSTTPGVVTASRILRHWADVPSSQRPALFMAQGQQTAIRRNNLPPKWEMGAAVYVYAVTDGHTPPGAILNPILDAIQTALEPSAVNGVNQTLGGLVEYARIDGTIETDEGALGNEAVAIIPIKILTL